MVDLGDEIGGRVKKIHHRSRCRGGCSCFGAVPGAHTPTQLCNVCFSFFAKLVHDGLFQCYQIMLSLLYQVSNLLMCRQELVRMAVQLAGMGAELLSILVSLILERV